MALPQSNQSETAQPADSTHENNFLRLWDILFSCLPQIREVFKQRWENKCGETWSGNNVAGSKLYNELCKNKFMKKHLCRSPYLKERLTTGCVERWDLTLLHTVFRHFTDNNSQQHQEENRALDKIKEIRNFLAHLSNGKVSTEEYHQKLEVIQCCLEKLRIDSAFVKTIDKSIIVPKKYTKCSPQFSQFLQSDCEENNILIISTLDCTITTEKLREHGHHNIILFDTLTFLKHVSCTSARAYQKLPVVTVLDNFFQMLKTLKYLKQKVAVIATEKPENIDASMKEMKIKTASICEDVTTWNDLTPIHQYLIESRLTDMFNLSIPCKILKHLQNNILIDLINGRVPKGLYCDGIPQLEKFYISRKLLTRATLSKRIFTSQKSDVFLFTGIERSELANFTRENITGMSQRQTQEAQLTSRYIILECDKHFEEICEKTQYPVHHVIYQEGSFHWVRSHRNVVFLQECLCEALATQTETNFVENACESDYRNQPICISDSAGMGKSQLLASIGHRLTEKCKSQRNYTFFISASALVSKIKKYLILSDPNIELIRSSLAALISLTELGKFVLTKTLESHELTVELLVDGFDEVDPNELEFGYNCISLMKDSLPSVRLWITTRPHLLCSLENCLAVLGHKIEAFDRSKQIKFLLSLWSQSLSPEQILSHGEENKSLNTYATCCLDALQLQTNSKDIEIAGIPLQCMLIGEVYRDDAVKYAYQEKMGSFPPPKIRRTSVTDLYIKVIEKKISIYAQRHNKQNRNTTHIMNFHKYIGLTVLFPRHTSFFRNLLHTTEVCEEDLLNIGLLEIDNSKVSGQRLHFIHRTFAEYFVATFAVEMIMITMVQDTLAQQMSSLIYDILDNQPVTMEFFGFGKLSSELTARQFINKATCHFVEHLLTGTSEFSEFVSPCLKEHFTNSKEIVDIGKTCLHDDNPNILAFCQFFNSQIPENETFLMEVYKPQTLIICTRQCNLDVIKLACYWFKKISRFRITSDLHAWNGTNILNVAVERGDFSIVEYLLHVQGFREKVEQPSHLDKSLLHVCVNNSLRNDEHVIFDKIQIINLLLQINRNLLWEQNYIHYFRNKQGVLLCDSVDPRLIVYLVQCGADVEETHYDGTTFLHKTASYLSSDEFNLMLTEIKVLADNGVHHVKDSLKRIIKGPEECGYRYTPLHAVLARMEPKVETLNVFRELEANFNMRKCSGDTILEVAVKHYRSVECLRRLIDYGADLNMRNSWRNQNILHVAAFFGHVEAVEFFLREKEMDVNVKDDQGDTPLDYALAIENSDGHNLNRYLVVKLLVNAGANRCTSLGNELLIFKGLLREESVEVRETLARMRMCVRVSGYSFSDLTNSISRKWYKRRRRELKEKVHFMRTGDVPQNHQ